MKIRITYPKDLKADLIDTLFDEKLKEPPKNRKHIIQRAREAIIGSSRAPEALRKAVMQSNVLDAISTKSDIEFLLLEEEPELLIEMRLVGPQALSEKQIWEGVGPFPGAKRQMKRVLDDFCDINQIPRESCRAEVEAD